jgi:2-oxoisovalerate dehydrogenase E2 component (dihydrolipoyl transacylase)
MVEITAPKAGRITKLYHEQQSMARVHSPLFAFIPRDREEAPQPKSESRPSADAAPTKATPVATGTRARIPASPAVRRLVREHELNLGDIAGSGKDGRVLKADVLAHHNSLADAHHPPHFCADDDLSLSGLRYHPGDDQWRAS